MKCRQTSERTIICANALTVYIEKLDRNGYQNNLISDQCEPMIPLIINITIVFIINSNTYKSIRPT